MGVVTAGTQTQRGFPAVTDESSPHITTCGDDANADGARITGIYHHNHHIYMLSLYRNKMMHHIRMCVIIFSIWAHAEKKVVIFGKTALNAGGWRGVAITPVVICGDDSW